MGSMFTGVGTRAWLGATLGALSASDDPPHAPEATDATHAIATAATPHRPTTPPSKHKTTKHERPGFAQASGSASLCKPSSVSCPGHPGHGGDHSSGTTVARRLVRPTRRLERAALKRLPMRPCSRWGLPCRPRCRGRGGLLPRLFTLAVRPRGGTAVCFSVALSSTFPPPGVTRHRALWSSDFPPVALPRPAITRAARAPLMCTRAAVGRNVASSGAGDGGVHLPAAAAAAAIALALSVDQVRAALTGGGARDAEARRIGQSGTPPEPPPLPPPLPLLLDARASALGPPSGLPDTCPPQAVAAAQATARSIQRLTPRSWPRSGESVRPLRRS